jgi:protein-tyrosine phosphatase
MTENMEKVSVLFVCMGNICRSPTAEGVFRHSVKQAGLEEKIEIDSAGTHAYHVGEPPDRRAIAAAERRGFSLADIRARRVQPEDFGRFHYIVAMDLLNLHMLNEMLDELLNENPDDAVTAEVGLLLKHATGRDDDEVPDPYYGGASGFERVLDLCEEASRALLETLRKRHAF